MQYKDAALGDTVYFWLAANDTTGTAADGTTPLFDVRLAGAAAGAAPVLSGTPILLSHANYSDGLYEVPIAATSGNGFAAGNEYAVFCTLTISTVNPAGFVGSVKVRALAADLNAAITRLLLALPAAAADGAGGLPISDAGGLDMDVILSRIDALISSRLSSTGYTAPDNTTITAINAKTTNLSTAPASVGSQMDLVNAPNATAIAAFTTNISASWAIQAILSNARGKVSKVGNAYTFYSTDNVTPLHTITYSTTSSDRNTTS